MYVPVAGMAEPLSCSSYSLPGQRREKYYNNILGQSECKKCACSGKKGAKSCDLETGFCTCKFSYTDSEGRPLDSREPEILILIDCKTKQDVPQSIGLAYAFMSFMILGYIPLLFLSGFLAVVAAVWRNDLNIVLFKMYKRTVMAFHQQVERIHRQQLEYEEKELRRAFDEIDDDKSGHIDINELYGLLLYLVPEYAEQYAVLEEILKDCQDMFPQQIHFLHLRELVAMVAEKIAAVEKDNFFRQKFLEYDDDGDGCIVVSEMEAILHDMSDSFRERDRRHALTFLNKHGEMNMVAFMNMMHSLALRKRVQQLNEEKLVREQQYLEVFRHASGGSRTISERHLTVVLNKLNFTISKVQTRALLRTVRLIDDAEITLPASVQFPKSATDRALILEELNRHYFFAGLSSKTLYDTMMSMEPKSFQAGDVVISEGENGKEFFVLLRGICDVFVDGVGLVHTYNANKKRKKSTGSANAFGELALIHNSPRSATITCRVDCNLCILSAYQFRRLLSKQDTEDARRIHEKEQKIRNKRKSMRKTLKSFPKQISGKEKSKNLSAHSKRAINGSLFFGRRTTETVTDNEDSEQDSTAAISIMHAQHADEEIGEGSTGNNIEDCNVSRSRNAARFSYFWQGRSLFHKRRQITSENREEDRQKENVVTVSKLHATAADEEAGSRADDIDFNLDGDEGALNEESRLSRGLSYIWKRFCSRRELKSEGTGGSGVTFLEYRRLISLVVMHKAVHWPEIRYQKDFARVHDQASTGSIPIDAHALQALLKRSHIMMDDFQAQHEIYELDRGDGRLLFDDFVTLMQRYHPEDVERRLMAKLHNKGDRLGKQLRIIVMRLLLFPVFVIFSLILNLFKLVINIYLVASSLHDPEVLSDELEEIFKAIINGMKFVGGVIPGLDMGFFEALAELLFSFLRYFEFEISLKGGVTCVGMQSPLCTSNIMYEFLQFTNHFL